MLKKIYCWFIVAKKTETKDVYKESLLLLESKLKEVERQNKALFWMSNDILSKIDVNHPFYSAKNENLQVTITGFKRYE